jgi:hypothetical protein
MRATRKVVHLSGFVDDRGKGDGVIYYHRDENSCGVQEDPVASFPDLRFYGADPDYLWHRFR